MKGRAAPGNLSENHDRQSPISVLDSLFEKEERTTPDSAGHIKPDQRGRISQFQIFSCVCSVLL